MNIRLILYFNGIALLFISFFLLIPTSISLLSSAADRVMLLQSFVITFTTGIILYFANRKHGKDNIRHREAFIIVTLTWVTMSFFGSVPFLLSGSFPSFTDAYFESMAGFTTTGASVLANIEDLPKGILFWRSMTQWIGGMGIIVFALAILPFLGTGGMQLFKAEVPGISVDKLRPRIIDTAKALWGVYVLLTAIETVLLYTAGMNMYDAVTHAFTTMATGGFSTKNSSIAYFQKPSIEYITSFFMFLAGVNFSLHFFLFRGDISKLWKSSEFRFYLAIVALAVILVTSNLWKSSYDTLEESFRYGLFHVVSIMTTTGYATADYEKWAPLSQIILIILMFFGGMVGSTAGGIKQVRIMLMIKKGYKEMYQLIHPHAVSSIKLNDRIIDWDIVRSIWGMVFLFIGVCTMATILMTALGQDIVTSTTAVISATCNVGPAFGSVGPSENFASIPFLGKWILIFCMLTGRLEVYTVLILFLPQFWKT